MQNGRQPWGDRSAGSAQFRKEQVRGAAGRVAEFFKRAVSHLGHKFGNLFDVRWFASLPAIGHGGEVRGIGFEHELAGRDGGYCLTDGLGVLEGDDASEADDRSEGQDSLHGGGIIDEAMEDAAHPLGKGGQSRQGVVQRIAGVDDAIEPKFGGDFELLFEQGGLSLLVKLIVGLGPARLAAGQAVVVQAGFADRDDLGMAGEVAQGGAHVVGSVLDVGGMPADGGKDRRVLFAEFDCAGAAFQVGADGNNLRDAGGMRALDDRHQVTSVIQIVQMRVCIVKCQHNSLKLATAAAGQNCGAAARADSFAGTLSGFRKLRNGEPRRMCSDGT